MVSDLSKEVDAVTQNDLKLMEEVATSALPVFGNADANNANKYQTVKKKLLSLNMLVNSALRMPSCKYSGIHPPRACMG